MTLHALHQRLCALLALTAVLAFISGAGLEAPAALPSAVLLLAGVLYSPAERLRRRLELLWRALVLLLAARAAWHVFVVPEDVVAPMVDLLLLLAVAETFRAQDDVGAGRLYALSFALLIAAAAYRPGVFFGVLFIAYLGVLTLTLTVGHLARELRVRAAPQVRLERRFLWQSAAFSAIALLVAGTVFLGFPRVSRGFGARGLPAVSSVVGFADRVSLLEHGGRIYPNPEVVLRVEFPDGAAPEPGALYWRGRAYDRFDGWTWSRTGVAAPPTPVARWPQDRTGQLIYQAPLGAARVLFGLHPIVSVQPRSRLLAFREPGGDYAYSGIVEPVYAVTSVRHPPPPDSLRRVAQRPVPPGLLPFLRLPALSPRMLALADSLRQRGDNPYDRTLAVRDWLRSEFRYTLELPRTARETSLEYFLFTRREGHCEYFSTSLAVLLRTMGIPARNVNGFLGGEWNEFGQFLTVTQNHAHSWVEVWFPDFGWVPFDATPAGSAGAAAVERGWFTPLRAWLAGAEHRWGKWVLDYDLDDQGTLLRAAAEPFVRSEEASTETSGAVPWPALLALGALVLVPVLLAALRRRGARGAAAGPSSGATRAYLRLRRAYAPAWAEERLPPLAFAERLSGLDAPGAADATAAVALYVRARFRGDVLDREALAELDRRVRAARAAVRTRAQGSSASGSTVAG